MVDMHQNNPRRLGPATRLAAAGSLAALLLAAAAAGAAAAERNSFAYDPPDRPPRGARIRYVELPAELALNQIAAHLRGQGLTVEKVDESERLVVARFSGDPRDYVDCGVVRMLVDGKAARPPKQYSANRPETRTYRTVRGGRRVGILRELHLDARVAVRVEESGKGARVTSDAIYVLTKTSSRLFKGGEPGPAVNREVASFKSSEIGRFKKGTSCIASGRLEDLPTATLRKSS